MLTSPIQSLCSPLRSELLKHWSLGNCPIEPDYLRSDIAFFEDPLHQWIYSVQLLNHQDATGAVRKWWNDALDGFNLRPKNIKTIRHLQNNSAWCSSRARVSLIANLKYRSQDLSSCSQDLVSLSPCLQSSAILGQRHGCLASPYVYQHRLDPKISRYPKIRHSYCILLKSCHLRQNCNELPNILAVGK